MFSAILFLTIGLLTNAADVASATYAGHAETSFSLSGQITISNGDRFILSLTDPSGCVPVMAAFRLANSSSLRTGDHVHLTGTIKRSDSQRPTDFCSAVCESFDVFGHEELPPTITTTVDEVQSGKLDGRSVRVGGVLRKIARDEASSPWMYLSLDCRDKTIYLACPWSPENESAARDLLGADVQATGYCSPPVSVRRSITGRLLHIDFPQGIVVRNENSPKNEITPLIDDNLMLTPDEIARLGRRRAVGTVIAVCRNRLLLLREPLGRIRNVRLSADTCPKNLMKIEVIGLVETDLYRLNLTDATWKPADGPSHPEDHVYDVSASDLLTDRHGNPEIGISYHGRTVRLEGTILDIPNENSGQVLAMIKCGDFTIPVDLTVGHDVLNGAIVGCRISLTGVCVVETESWNPFSTFPQASGVTITPRSPADIRILAHPPWWTPAKLTILVATLLALLAAIFIWNRFLKRVIDRKSRELTDERIAQLGSQLRFEERTNLAVDLHDTLSQVLTGAAMEIEAARKMRGDAPSDMVTHLETAGATLQSCRDELRNCLWDLRSQALEEPDMTTAIRKTLMPHVNDSRISIRFNVPRKRLSDNTAHSILRMIRELVLNAIRHGQATAVKIAGSLDADGLRFSVTDNGAGFDQTSCPGVLQGHFGLQGVRERLRLLGGTVAFDSAPGRGTRVSAFIPFSNDSPPEE